MLSNFSAYIIPGYISSIMIYMYIIKIDNFDIYFWVFFTAYILTNTICVCVCVLHKLSKNSNVSNMIFPNWTLEYATIIEYLKMLFLYEILIVLSM